ncbi:MAG TPA: cellobiose phosphorylase [Candidatus Omnitrophota bacterium]|nr:cellobiose phosphorylase [Candidatus Omnitrophota bacterium]HRZ15153.1 cellobiose phosphorylase [Candidatus Omnitrophota bacterium]
MSKGSLYTNKINYHLNKDGEFIIENYNYAKPLANFFPGIAGKYGIPMWVFYVNRGQAINSFGTDGKDSAILEFQPANKAWQTTSLNGFRTFIKLSQANNEIFYEPFHDGIVNRSFAIANQMAMSSCELRLEESNATLGLKTTVEYFTIPQECFAALVRIVTITNTARKRRSLQVLDGLPQIIPYGIANLFLKKLSRTIEAWMGVENLDTGVPFYKVDVDPIDRPQVLHIKGGNFYLSFVREGKKARIIKPIVDPDAIFGQISDFSCPRAFLDKKRFTYPAGQQTQCKTPCGFTPLSLDLAPGASQTFCTVIGHARNVRVMNASVKRIIAPGYLEAKNQANKRLIAELQSDVETGSSSWEFDYYCKQTYLDNIMRGGYPALFGSGADAKVFYLYSRKHGDLERDYNKFQIQPTYFSQGNGNYRDMNQNRRCDVWFNPGIKDFNIITFFNLLQSDGFNPLVVKGATFSLKNKDAFAEQLRLIAAEKDIALILGLLEKPFTPGQVIMDIEEHNCKLKLSHDDFLTLLFSHSVKNPEADHGEGFWIDHWHYNLDLIENFLAVYPEKLKELVFEKKVFTFYDNDSVVRPRSEKYILLDGHPKQLHSVAHSPEKKELIGARLSSPHTLRTEYGKGDVYTCTLINKLFCLLVNKLASFDPAGAGIEMEADKPNWFDALNGLPALFGSSACETFELKRLILFIRDALRVSGVQQFSLTEEIYDFLQGLTAALRDWERSNDKNRDMLYWDASATLKEEYRARTTFGFKGGEKQVFAGDMPAVLELALKKTDSGIAKARDEKKSLYYGYFINEVTAFENIDATRIRPTQFAQKRVPLFLEGLMHAMRLTEDKEHAHAIYKAVKTSELYDKELQMYRVTASLASMPEEIGRCTAFTPGWLENQSIWLHMEYKYLLELLRQGIYEDFFADFRKVLIPFLKPERYGRSILENSSFLVSSAFPYKQLHGNGFVARLSGSTVEFLSMWLLMNLGRQPFFLNDKQELNLRFAPALPGWLFDKKGKTYRFTLLGRIPVVYHNPLLKDAFGSQGVKPVKITLNYKDNKSVTILSDTLSVSYAHQVRNLEVTSIKVDLA